MGRDVFGAFSSSHGGSTPIHDSRQARELPTSETEWPSHSSWCGIFVSTTSLPFWCVSTPSTSHCCTVQFQLPHPPRLFVTIIFKYTTRQCIIIGILMRTLRAYHTSRCILFSIGLHRYVEDRLLNIRLLDPPPLFHLVSYVALRSYRIVRVRCGNLCLSKCHQFPLFLLLGTNDLAYPLDLPD